jgi:hypothetical protein
VTRLPLGLQSGWTIARNSSDGDVVRIGVDRGVIGPSGSPALRMTAGEKTKLHAAPFAVAPDAGPHTASVYLRGPGKAAVSVFGAAGAARAQIELSPDDWRRAAVTFRPSERSSLYAIVFELEGTVWLDALQVAQGSPAGPYAAHGACEVSLAAEEESLPGAMPIRVQFADRPARVRWAVTGAAPGSVLRGKVVTPYGREAALPPVALGRGFLTEGQWRYDRVPGVVCGPFRVEAWVEDSRGRLIGPPNEVVVYRLRRPRYWGKDAPASPFGVHTLSTTRHIRMAKAVGINWTRLHDAGTRYIGWYHLEPQPGTWQFQDEPLRRYRRHHMKVLGLLSTAPPWASYCDKPRSGYFDRYFQPRRPEQFAHYVRRVVRRYRGLIDAYDIWNEPWVNAFWIRRYDESRTGRGRYVTSERPHVDYARLSAAAYEAAKDVDRTVLIAGINTTTHAPGEHVVAGQEWTRRMVGEAALAHCDVVGYHYYTRERLGRPGDGAEAGHQRAIGPIDKASGGGKPVWMTEGSPTPRMLGEGFYHYTLPYAVEDDPFDAGDRLARYLVTLLALRVEKIFLYSMHCHWYFGSKEYAVLVTPEGYLHPSAAAHSAAAWLLEGSRFAWREELAKGVTAYAFTAADRAVVAVCPVAPHAAWRLPERNGVEALDLFGNPVPPGAAIGEHLVYLVYPRGRLPEAEDLRPRASAGR